jgi:hypothetical protein
MIKRSWAAVPILLAVLAISVIGSESASAAWRCLSSRFFGLFQRSAPVGQQCRVYDRSSGRYGLFQTAGATAIETGELCALVESDEPSLFDGSNCGASEEHKGESEYEIALTEPQFGTSKDRFTTKTSLALLETASTSPVDCASSVSTGEVTGAKSVGSLVVIFSGCHSNEGAGCSVKGGGGGTGNIITNTLDGELGTVSAKEAASEVGLLLLPTSGKTFVTLEGSCLISSPSAVEGSVAGEVTPLYEESKTGKLIFTGTKGKQDIKDINILGKVVEPALKALGLLASSEDTSGEVTYESAIEVT